MRDDTAKTVIVLTQAMADFNPTILASACYLGWNDKILLLQQARGNLQEYTWGVPAGKLEASETPLEAVLRESYEETGLSLHPAEVKFFKTLYIRCPAYDFIYHMFQQDFNELPDIKINSREHQDFIWVTLEEAFKMPLRQGGVETLEYYQRYKNSRKATIVEVC